MNNSAPRKRLPVHPSLEHLQKQAKRLAKTNPSLKLAEAQHQLAREYGCRNWAELAHVVETMRRGGDQLSNVQREIEPLPKAARLADRKTVENILQSGAFTQHDLDQGLAHSLWYEEHGTWEERKALADLLLAQGADPDGQYGSNYGPIVFGTCECLHPAGLKYLIDAGADVTFPPIQTKYGRQCPLSNVLGTYNRGRNQRKHEMIDLLLRQGAYVPPEITAPVLAVHQGDVETLSSFLEKDSNLLQQQFPGMPYGNIELKGATLLHCAVELGEMECLELLFEQYHADINIKAAVIDGIGGQTPIYHAINTCGDGNFHILEYLAKRVGPWIDMSIRATWRSSGDGVQSIPMTPLEYARQAATGSGSKWRKRIQEELSILQSLDSTEKIKAALRHEDAGTVNRLLNEQPELLTPVLWPEAIFQAKSLAMTKLLLERGLNPDECSAPRKPLHLAVYQCLPEIVELLIAHGADVNLRNPLDETPLELLDAYEPRPIGDPDAARIRRALREAGATDDFYSIIRAGETSQVRAMLEKDPALARSDSSLGGPLFTAARSGRAAIVSTLLEFGANPNKTNDKGNTPLWFAAQSPAKPASNRIEVMKILLEAGADINRRCEKGSTALHFAAWRGPAEVVEFLLSRGAQKDALDDEKQSPHDYAKKNSVATDSETIGTLLLAPQDPTSDSSKSAPEDEAILKAVLENDPVSLRKLLDRHPEKISLTGAQWNKPLLHCAAWEGHLPIVQELLKRGFNVNARCESDHACAIHFASERGHLDIVRTLADAGADLEAGDNDHQLTVLGWATTLGACQEAVARFLLSRGAAMTIWAALSLNDSASVRSLIQKNPALLQARLSRNEHFRTLLHHAVEHNHPEMVKLLLELGADPNAKDSMGLGPLGSIKGSTDPRILSLLNIPDKDISLHDALVLGHYQKAENLLDADPASIRPGGKEARLFVYAVVRKNWPMAEWLLKHGCDINAKAEVYECMATALHFAASDGEPDRVRWLLDQGADTTIKDDRYHADAANWAEFFKRPDIVKMIEEHRANISPA